MTLQELTEGVIQGDVRVPRKTTYLNSYGMAITGDFDCSGTLIQSLKGGPFRVGGNFNCSNTMINSLQGCPKDVGGHFFCFNTNIVSLRDIHKHVNRIHGDLVIPAIVQFNILGVLRITDLHQVVAPKVKGNQQLIKALEIINRYLAHKPPNVDKARDELLRAKLGEFAMI